MPEQDTDIQTQLKDDRPSYLAAKKSQQNICIPKSRLHWKDHWLWSSYLYSRDLAIVVHTKINKCNNTLCKHFLKGRNQMIISIDSEKPYDKIWTPSLWRDGSLIKSNCCSCRGLTLFSASMLGAIATVPGNPVPSAVVLGRPHTDTQIHK